MTRAFVVIGFLIAFAAGWIVGASRGDGWAMRPGGSEPTTQPAERSRGTRSEPGSYLAQQLGLSAQQQAAMREIWSEVAGRGGRQMGEQRRQLRQRRDEAIAKLVRPEDQAAYDAVIATYEADLSALERDSRQAFMTAVEKTKAILTEQQRIKYEQILRQWDGRGGRDRERRHPMEKSR